MYGYRQEAKIEGLKSRYAGMISADVTGSTAIEMAAIVINLYEAANVMLTRYRGSLALKTWALDQDRGRTGQWADYHGESPHLACH